MSTKSAGLCPVSRTSMPISRFFRTVPSFGGIAGKESFLAVPSFLASLSFLTVLGMTVFGLGERERLLASLEVGFPGAGIPTAGEDHRRQQGITN